MASLSLLSRFSPWADLYQPLHSLWSPIPECHVDIAHRLKHTQMTHHHSKLWAITIKGVCHREHSLSGSQRAAAGATLKVWLHAALYNFAFSPCVAVRPAYVVCAPHVCLMPTEARRGIPWNWSQTVVSHLQHSYVFVKVLSLFP